MHYITNIAGETDFLNSELWIIRARSNSAGHCTLEIMSSLNDVEEKLTEGSIASCESYLSEIDGKESLSENEVEEYFS